VADDALLVACRCNGLSYTMNYVDEAPKLDEVIEASDGILPFPDSSLLLSSLELRDTTISEP